MKVFVTGATGFIGSAVVKELLGAGHQVLGLTRSEAGAKALAQMGADVHRGELSDPDSLAAGAGACDGVAHLAFDHGFGTTPLDVGAGMDRRAVEAMTGALEGTGKPLVMTSGTLLLAFGRAGAPTFTEEDAPVSLDVPRAASEDAALQAAERGVRSSVIRLSPSVHGAGDHGFVPILIETARRTGVSAYIGEGANRWPAVHRLDAASLYRLALEKAAPGARLHGVAEEGVPLKAIAETIGAGLGLPVRSLSPDEAPAHFGWIAMFVGTDGPTSSALTRRTLGWDPQGPGLLTDVRENGYFA